MVSTWPSELSQGVFVLSSGARDRSSQFTIGRPLISLVFGKIKNTLVLLSFPELFPPFLIASQPLSLQAPSQIPQSQVSELQ